jgi:phosphohistidine phosphatase
VVRRVLEEELMRVWLVRHAVAEAKKSDLPDAARALTAKGRDRFVKAVKGLERLGVRFDRMYHSPKLRAVETAEALVPLLDGETIVTPHLASAPSPKLLDEVKGERVALVGHDPYLSSLVAWLVVGQKDKGRKFPMKKGGVIVLDGELRPGAMRLVASCTPKALRKMA